MEFILLTFIIISLFTGCRKGLLGCGLIGFAPKYKKEANLDWIKLIMSYNTLRGTDTCGIYINEKTDKGIKHKDGPDESDIRVYLANKGLQYDDACKNKLIIGHTRKSTRGLNDWDGAHPFTFEHEGRSITLAHNGTITNIHAMSYKYDVDTKGLTVDSQILAKIILEKGYDVLNNYEGGTAILFTYSDEPGVLYAFKGASKTKRDQKELEEERPLYLMTNHEGVYISSLREPLDACCNRDLIVYTFKNNFVTKIKNGNLELVYEANREEANLPAPVVFPKEKTGTTSQGGGMATGKSDSGTSPFKSCVKIKKPSDIYHEITYSAVGDHYIVGALYFIAGRYYEFGFGFRDGKFKDVKHLCPSMDIDNALLDGEKWIADYSDHGYPSVPYVRTSPPIRSELGIRSANSKRLFYKGVLIKREKESKFVEKRMAGRFDGMVNLVEKIKQLSSYAEYPITFTYEESKKIKEDAIKLYMNGHLISTTMSIRPLWSNRMYVICPKSTIKTVFTVLRDDTIVNKPFEITVENDDVTPYTWNMEDHLDKTIYLVKDEETIFRYKGVTAEDERKMLDNEMKNGIAPTTYHSLIDENQYVCGEDMMIRAVSNLLFDILYDTPNSVTMDEAESMAFKYCLEGSVSREGMIKYMEKKFPTIDYMHYVYDAFTDSFAEIFAKLEDDVKEAGNVQNVDSEDVTNFKEQVGNESFN